MEEALHGFEEDSRLFSCCLVGTLISECLNRVCISYIL